MIIFCDVDEVLALNGKLQPDLVQNLTRIIDRSTTIPRIIMNTAWNRHSLQEMREHLKNAGFPYAGRICGQTDGCQGGWGLAHKWLVDNQALGQPYLILEDRASGWGSSWGRLAHCRDNLGLTRDVASRAIDIMTRPITEHGERQACVMALMTEWDRLSRVDYLSEKDQRKLIQDVKTLVVKVIRDKDFLRSAHLIR